MLLRFAVTNHRSIRDRQDLSFVASSLSERTPIAVPVQPSGERRVLPSVGIFGANGSGKSAMLLSLTEMAARVAVTPIDAGAVRRPAPFLLDETGSARPTEFEADILVDGVQYTYGFAVDDSGVVREWLHAYPLGRRQVWFERDASRSESFRFPGEHLHGHKNRLADLVRPDALYLSVAVALNHPQLRPIAAWFHNVVAVPEPQAVGVYEDAFATLFESKHAQRAKALLCRADLGIRDIRVVDHPAHGPTVDLVHAGPAGDRTLPVRLESLGTHAWLWLIIDLLYAMDLGGVLVVDELDRLHPDLAAEAVRLFHDPRVNAKRAQLLFASHDPTVMGMTQGVPLLERDQVWFTEKRGGVTELFSLAAFKPRKSENIERRYRLGHFGAIPDLSPGELGLAVRAADEVA